MGIPTPALVEMGRLYAEGVETMQRAVVDLYTTGGTLRWAPGELEAFQAVSASSSDDILPRARRIVDYLHHRTIQRLTLDAIEHLPDPGQV